VGSFTHSFFVISKYIRGVLIYTEEKMASKILAIMPARGGSKGLPRKNVLILAGKPMIAHSICAAKNSECVDRIVVSTDNEEIAEVSRKYGAEVINRPKELARDESPTIDAVMHALGALGDLGYEPDAVVLLQPTSPIRLPQDIDGAVDAFLKGNGASVISVCEASHPPFWDFKIEDGMLKPLFGAEYFRKRRQELPKAYVPNGSVYVSSPESLRKNRSFVSERIVPYVMPQDRSIDVDTAFDFRIAEALLSSK
jgi:CMP-N-acetylneuraminic acid synthetase